MKDHGTACAGDPCTCTETACYTRHEPAPGVHQDIPHLNTQCMKAEHHHHWTRVTEGWHCHLCGEVARDLPKWGQPACTCTYSFGQMVWSSECTNHERCPVTMRGIPIQCVLAAGHEGDHK